MERVHAELEQPITAWAQADIRTAAWVVTLNDAR